MKVKSNILIAKLCILIIKSYVSIANSFHAKSFQHKVHHHPVAQAHWHKVPGTRCSRSPPLPSHTVHATRTPPRTRSAQGFLQPHSAHKASGKQPYIYIYIYNVFFYAIKVIMSEEARGRGIAAQPGNRCWFWFLRACAQWW